MTRLYGKNEEINKENVKEFFDKRANKEVDSLMTITSFQDKENLDQRQIEESKILLENIDLTGKKIIEIGCGLGRWAEVFHDKCESYLGLDYAENLIKPPFDIIFIAGVLIYLNDEDISQMIKEINKIASKDKIIYIRETISVMDTRLTLKDFYSEDLDADYNAIYRTKDELLEFFKGFENITNIKSDKIHETLNKHDETGYRYFILK